MNISEEVVAYEFQCACWRDLLNALHCVDGLKLISDEE